MKTKWFKAKMQIIIVKKGSGIGDAMLGCSEGAYPWGLLDHLNKRVENQDSICLGVGFSV